LSDWDRTTNGSTNHLFRAACPTDVFPRVLNGDRQVIAASVLASLGTGGALRHVIPPDLPNLAYMVKDSKFVAEA